MNVVRKHRIDIFTLTLCGILIAITSAPYAIASAMTPENHFYTGLLHNIDDSAVYLSWMRQVAEGAFFQENRFCVEPQKSVLFNLWFLFLGTLSRFIPAIWAYHTGRIIGVIAVVLSLRFLSKVVLKDESTRRLAIILTTCLSGFGYVMGGFDPSRGFMKQPIDLFQPEISIFQSCVYSPLFAPATALLVFAITSFIKSEVTTSWRGILPAGIATAILGNIHSYDVLHVLGVVLLIRISADVMAGTFDRQAWYRLAVLVAMSIPTTAWVYYATRIDPLFAARADTSTRTASLLWVCLGFGVAFPLAFVACVRAVKNKVTNDILMATWFVGALLVAHLPFAFQRKMLMGAEVPIAFLAAVALRFIMGKLSGDFPKILLGATYLVAVPTNLIWLQDTMARLGGNAGSTQMRPYLMDTERDALLWLSKHAKPHDAVLVAPDPSSHLRFPGVALMPHLSVYVPALSGATVYDGHWSETLNYGKKLRNTIQFFDSKTSDDVRKSFLSEAGIHFVLSLTGLSKGPIKDATGADLIASNGTIQYLPVSWVPAAQPDLVSGTPLPEFLKIVFENKDVVIYEVML